jgi:hypothetical protein
MNSTGALMLVLGVFVIARLVTKDSHGQTLAARLAGSKPDSSSSSSTSGPAPTSSGASTIVASQATGAVARTHSPAFARDVLRSLQAPQTAANINSLTKWFGREGNIPSIDRYNPLDTTLYEPGALSTNSVGVKSYKSWAQGVSATAATLAGGYPSIVSALKSGLGIKSQPGVSSELLKWSGGGYGAL